MIVHLENIEPARTIRHIVDSFSDYRWRKTLQRLESVVTHYYRGFEQYGFALLGRKRHSPTLSGLETLIAGSAVMIQGDYVRAVAQYRDRTAYDLELTRHPTRSLRTTAPYPVELRVRAQGQELLWEVALHNPTDSGRVYRYLGENGYTLKCVESNADSRTFGTMVSGKEENLRFIRALSVLEFEKRYPPDQGVTAELLPCRELL